MHFTLADALPHLTQPFLIVHGGHDLAIPLTDAQQAIKAAGDPLERPERERNMVWRCFTGLPTHVVRAHAEQRGRPVATDAPPHDR
jgi:hypothetical protein